MTGPPSLYPPRPLGVGGPTKPAPVPLATGPTNCHLPEGGGPAESSNWAAPFSGQPRCRLPKEGLWRVTWLAMLLRKAQAAMTGRRGGRSAPPLAPAFPPPFGPPCQRRAAPHCACATAPSPQGRAAVTSRSR